MFFVASCLPFVKFFLSLKRCRSVLCSCFKNKRTDCLKIGVGSFAAQLETKDETGLLADH